jgi:hypothetical protein
MPHEVAPDTPHRNTEAPPPVATTFIGRIVLGTVLALGLYLALHTLLTGLLVAADAAEHWSLSFNGLMLNHAAQAAAVVFGALIAAAGRPRGYSVGVTVGGLSGVGFLAHDVFAGASPNDLVLYVQPPMLALIALCAGSLGSWIWEPAPELDYPISPTSKFSSIQLIEDAIAKPEPPTQWVRVAIGAAIMVVGVVLADDFRKTAQKFSAGLLRVESLGQGEFVTWQLGMFSVLAGGMLAGAATSAGLRHGLLAGVLGGVGVYGMCAKVGGVLPPVAWWVSSMSLQDHSLGAPEVMLTIIASVTTVGVIGGWMGGMIFPKLAPASMLMRTRPLD